MQLLQNGVAGISDGILALVRTKGPIEMFDADVFYMIIITIMIHIDWRSSSIEIQSRWSPIRGFEMKLDQCSVVYPFFGDFLAALICLVPIDVTLHQS
jgi:hypothetical protein